MSRTYEILDCGCYISCDGGGGLISGCPEDENCQVADYMIEHEMIDGYCKICHGGEEDDKNNQT